MLSPPQTGKEAAEGEIIAVEMTKACARGLTDQIKTAVTDIGELLHQAHEGRAWAALGYLSWKQYCQTEFQMTRQRSYQLLSFCEIKNSIGACQPGLTPPASEKQIRPLAKLQPEQQVAAWKNAVEIAGGARPTAQQVAQAAGNVSSNETPPKLPNGLRDEIGDIVAAALNRAWEQLEAYPEVDWQIFRSIVQGWLRRENAPDA